MKKRMKSKLMCAALTTILTLGNYPGAYAYAAPDGTPAEEAQTDTVLTDAELAAYYGDSVFVGDSIMVGFRNYSAKQQSYVHDIQFLAVGSYSAFNAMKPVADKNVHPMYKGKKCQVWDAIPLIGSKRAFILLGMNDISILGLEGARDQYKELIGKILETSPDIEIHIISVTYTLKDQGKGKLNNENLAQYNTLLQEMAAENGWGYLDLCTPISDGEGNLAQEYCSDGFVHLSNAAYTLWESVLIEYADEQLHPAVPETDTTKSTAAENVTTQSTVPADTSLTGSVSKSDPASVTPKTSKAKAGTGTGASASQENKGRIQP